MDILFFSCSDIPRIPETSHPPLESSMYWIKHHVYIGVVRKWEQIFSLIRILMFGSVVHLSMHFLHPIFFYNMWCLHCLSVAGSSSFESQKMERPSISVLSPSSPSGLRDAPQLLPGQLSVSIATQKQSHLQVYSTVCFPRAVYRLSVYLCLLGENVVW